MLVGDTSWSKRVIGAAITVHTRVGPGLLESAYARCLEVELTKRAIPWQSQVPIPLRYDDLYIKSAYRADLVVAGVLVLELKSLKAIEPVHQAQLLTYMRLLEIPEGLLLNFNTPRLKQGIRRLIRPAKPPS